MYLPNDIPNARVLITVKTYPLPSGKYEELVCTAGLLDGKWVRIYPIPFGALPYSQQYKKYNWVQLDLIRNDRDFRPETYRPRWGIEGIRVVGEINTANNWAERKEHVYKEVFTSLSDLIALAKGDAKKSLATLRPREIVDFVIEEDERDWKPKWRNQLLQLNLFDIDHAGEGQQRRVLPKLPFKYYYKFLSDGDTKPRRLMIEDWEIGALFWKCLHISEGDEVVANRLVRQKYLDEFVTRKDLHLFLGTTKLNHYRAPNPFVIIGVFYPAKTEGPQQLSMF